VDPAIVRVRATVDPPALLQVVEDVDDARLVGANALWVRVGRSRSARSTMYPHIVRLCSARIGCSAAIRARPRGTIIAARSFRCRRRAPLVFFVRATVNDGRSPVVIARTLSASGCRGNAATAETWF